jgi:hypothetical protein
LQNDASSVYAHEGRPPSEPLEDPPEELLDEPPLEDPLLLDPPELLDEPPPDPLDEPPLDPLDELAPLDEPPDDPPLDDSPPEEPLGNPYPVLESLHPAEKAPRVIVKVAVSSLLVVEACMPASFRDGPRAVAAPEREMCRDAVGCEKGGQTLLRWSERNFLESSHIIFHFSWIC